MSKTISGTTTQFLYDRLNPVQELNSTGGVVANMLTGLRVDEYFSRTDTAPSTFLADALGSTVGLVGSGGTIATSYTYQPFGATTVGGSANGNSFQFTGRENDGSGVYYYRNRYYSPTFQRFVSQDPLGFAGGDTNLYGYVLNGPTNSFDPLGLDIAVIEGGPILNNPFGHTSIAITGEGTYSFGTAGSTPGMSLSTFLLSQATYRNSTVFVIHTTPAQDAAALASLTGQPHHMGPASQDNCSTRSNQALDAAGIPPLDMPMSPDIPSITAPLEEGGILPGSAGGRALQAGASVYNIPEGSTSIPGTLGQFEPAVP
jgi:RHS repeat-associated protein